MYLSRGVRLSENRPKVQQKQEAKPTHEDDHRGCHARVKLRRAYTRGTCTHTYKLVGARHALLTYPRGWTDRAFASACRLVRTSTPRERNSATDSANRSLTPTTANQPNSGYRDEWSGQPRGNPALYIIKRTPAL